jgi:hypothetical protein
MRLFILCISILFTALSYTNAQNVHSFTISWSDPDDFTFGESEQFKVLTFKGAIYNNEENGHLPLFYFSEKAPLNSGSVNAELVNVLYEEVPTANLKNTKSLELIINEPVLKSYIGKERKATYAMFYLLPLRRNSGTGKIERIVSGEIRYNITPDLTKSDRSDRNYADNSVLSKGEWYKIGVTADGVYKIDYEFLNSLGIKPENINPRNLKIYGNAGGMLPHLNSTPRVDDLMENPIFVSGELDNKFDKEDYIIFYGQSPHKWFLNPNTNNYQHQLHLFSDTTFYFLTFDNTPGKRIQVQNSHNSPANQTITSFDDYAFHENDIYNLIQSGRMWYGEKFEFVTSHNFSFSFPNIDMSQQAVLEADIIIRSDRDNIMKMTAGGVTSSISTRTLNNMSDYLSVYAHEGSGRVSFLPQSASISVNLEYPKTVSSSVAWLNFLRINVRRHLRMHGHQMHFRDRFSIGPNNVSEFILNNVIDANTIIWNVTDPFNISSQSFSLNAGTLSFRTKTDTLKEFIAFTDKGFMTPSRAGKIENQNLHAIGHPEMIIVTHPLFLNQARELADFHLRRGLSVQVSNLDHIYNEFSSGAPDVAAIRDFMKMLYDRASNQTELPKYLLLFGDGSYDNKNRGPSNSNFIPTYQSLNSLNPGSTFLTDDFFGLLDDYEGENLGVNELLDVGIGRLPAKSVAEAQNLVRKIRTYYDSRSMRDWRNMVTFIADDGDSYSPSIHMRHADEIADLVKSSYPVYNQDKIYLDAYPMVSTPGGTRFPEVNEAFDRRVERGTFILNYTGHGGIVGLAHERILTIPQINNWKNINNLPLFVTATCEFSRFDDPKITSAGEHVLLNPNGGAIALLTTVRLVYVGPNRTLNTNFYHYAFEPINGQPPRLGDLIRLTKIASGGSSNNRNFTLLGDPAVQLHYPKHQVVTSTIKGNDVRVTRDTIRALEKVTITGYIQDQKGQKLSSYNGILYPTVFDKEVTSRTLGQGPGNTPTDFNIQKNAIYRGKVSVRNGEFSFTFVVPKDIGYNFGFGRISYYAENGVVDAHGFFENFIIGGTAENAITDTQGPDIDLFMNNDKFVFGGMTNENPRLVAFVFDENGINTVGSGIGRDIVAVLNENTQKEIVLNDYYEADLDSYQKGAINYPFNKLDEGRHTLRLRVWDVFNNSSEAYTEFVVANSAELALKHVLNWPNPFTTFTEFHFEHNQPGAWLDVQVQIFTVSGKLVKTINTNMRSNGFKSDAITWDGRDDFGDKIGRGVYLYRIKVKANDAVAEKIEKLVILN